jgi:hypothetical protein
MRILLILILFVTTGGVASAQYVYVITADSVKLTSCDSSELIIENHTQAVPGFLYNKGRGRTEFRRAMISLNDSLYVFGKDTLNINKSLKSLPPQANADWNAVSGPALILNKPVIPVIPPAPTLSSVLTQGNTAIAGTTTKAPIVMVKGPLLTTTQPGAVEYDGHGYYITDSAGVRHDVTQTDRVFEIYSQDYASGSYTHNYTLIGWNVDYSTDIINAHTLASTMDFEITLPVGVPNGTAVSITFQGTTIYTLTVTGGAALTTERYVIGSVRINQDLKYATMFYVKGATETITNAGVLTSTGTAIRLYPQTFSNPAMVFTVTGSPSLVRIGCTYTIDKKQQGRYIF